MSKEKHKTIQPKKNTTNNKRQSQLIIENSRHLKFFGLASVVILGIIIYSNSFDCSFHLDSTLNIVDNALVKKLDIKSLWNYNHNRFVPYFSFALNYHFNQLNVFGYHLVNLMIHLLNSILVWWLTILIFSSPNIKNLSFSKHKNVIAIVTALFFVSHPLATQSVTYIVQRMASMAALFYFLSLALYMKARLSNPNNLMKYVLFSGVFVSGILAFLTKENTYTLPFAIFLFEIFFFQTRKRVIDLKDYRVWVIIACAMLFVIYVFMTYSSSIFITLPPDEFNDFRTITPMNYLFTQFSVIVKYIQLLILPLNQNFDYDFPMSNSLFEVRTILSFGFLLSLLALSIYYFNKNRIISFGILWFFLTLAVESSIVPISDIIFEHRTYLPSFGFFIVISSLIFNFFWDKNKNITLLIFVLIIGSNSILAHERNKVWKDELSLWNDGVLKSPNKGREYSNRGVYYFHHQKYDLALEDYNMAIKNRPQYAKAYYNRGVVLEYQKKHNLALEDYNKTIMLNPKYSDAYFSRGIVFLYQKKYEGALNDFNKSIELNPFFSDVFVSRATVFIHDKRFDEAMKDLNKSIELNPNYSKAYNNRGNLDQEFNEPDKALADYQKAINLKPDFADAFYNRAKLLAKLKRNDEALADYYKTIDLNPDNLDVYLDCGAFLSNGKRNEEAIKIYTKAIAVNANFADAYYNRGVAKHNSNKNNEACADWKKGAELHHQPSADVLNKYCK